MGSLRMSSAENRRRLLAPLPRLGRPDAGWTSASGRISALADANDEDGRFPKRVHDSPPGPSPKASVLLQ
jgi:hypothetical protein